MSKEQKKTLDNIFVAFYLDDSKIVLIICITMQLSDCVSLVSSSGPLYFRCQSSLSLRFLLLLLLLWILTKSTDLAPVVAVAVVFPDVVAVVLNLIH